jgi:hypothetical protein
MAWGRPAQAEGLQGTWVSSAAGSNSSGRTLDLTALMSQVNPKEGHRLPAHYGDLGPRLLESGAIDYGAFAAIYQDAGNPLTAGEIETLTRGSPAPIVITEENAHFLLNFFWAVGLVNKNAILTEGPMAEYDGGKIEGFASTGGWTLGSKPVGELYASLDLIALTPEQQRRVEEAASAIYRPCCDNSTLLPDCNHGMAMLGLLELMASQEASVDEMLGAAKYVNAYWFPQSALETAIYLKAIRDVDFADADERLLVGKSLSSGSGSGMVHQWLQNSGLLAQAPGQGSGCSS